MRARLRHPPALALCLTTLTPFIHLSPEISLYPLNKQHVLQIVLSKSRVVDLHYHPLSIENTYDRYWCSIDKPACVLFFTGQTWNLRSSLLDGCLYLSIPLSKHEHVCANMCVGITTPITAVSASLLQPVTCTFQYDLETFRKEWAFPSGAKCIRGRSTLSRVFLILIKISVNNPAPTATTTLTEYNFSVWLCANCRTCVPNVWELAQDYHCF